MTLLTNIINNLSDSSGILCLYLCIGWLFHLKLQVIDPEVSAIEVPVVVLLVHLTGFLNISFDLPQKTGPFGGKSTFSIDITLIALNLSPVDGNCSIQAALSSLKIGPGNDSFNVAGN